jgi:hypothetical protein
MTDPQRTWPHPSGQLRIGAFHCQPIAVNIDCATSPEATFACNDPNAPNIFAVEVSTGGPGEGVITVFRGAKPVIHTVDEGSINCREIPR